MLDSSKKKIAVKLRGRYTVTYFPAKISSALLQIVYHVNAEKDTGIVRLFVQIIAADIQTAHSALLFLTSKSLPQPPTSKRPTQPSDKMTCR